MKVNITDINNNTNYSIFVDKIYVTCLYNGCASNVFCINSMPKKIMTFYLKDKIPITLEYDDMIYELNGQEEYNDYE